MESLERTLHTYRIAWQKEQERTTALQSDRDRLDSQLTAQVATTKILAGDVELLRARAQTDGGTGQIAVDKGEGRRDA